MNEPTEYAQSTTGKVTAGQLRSLVKLYKGCIRSSLFMHGRAAYNRPSYSDAFVFTVSAVVKSKDSGPETTTTLEVPGWVSGGTTSDRQTHTRDAQRLESGNYLSASEWMTYSQPFRPVKGFWMLGYSDNLTNILALLPRDAEVAFHVYLDAGTNELLVRADCDMGRNGAERGLHHDKLYLSVTHKGKERLFLLDSHVSAHNTARFGYPSRFDT